MWQTGNSISEKLGTVFIKKMHMHANHSMYKLVVLCFVMYHVRVMRPSPPATTLSLHFAYVC